MTKNNENQRKFETLFSIAENNRQINVKKDIGTYEGHPYENIIIEHSKLMKDGTPFSKQIKDEHGKTHFVPDIKYISIPADVLGAVVKKLED